MHDAHGGMFEDAIAPNIEVVDYAEQQRLLREAQQARARAAAALVARAVPPAPVHRFGADNWWEEVALEQARERQAAAERARQLRRQEELNTQERQRREEATRLQWANYYRREEEARLARERTRQALEAERNRDRGWGCVVM